VTTGGGTAVDPLAAGQRRRGLDRERTVTLMSVDVVESTPLTARLDAEQLRDIMLAYHDLADQAVARFGGHVPSRQGDGFMARFGVPDPHEDAASRAARAALAVLEAIGPLQRKVAEAIGAELAVRIGIHTGPVVITEIAGAPELIGRTAHETARIESAATPNTVAVSAATRALLGPEFVVDDEREVKLKGFDDPMTIHTVRSVSAVAPSPVAVVPFVGRRDERRRLVAAWKKARAGAGSAALIVGDAGYGKSRLADYVANLAVRDGADRMTLAGRSYDDADPFRPLADLMRHRFSLDDEVDDDGRWAALVEGLERDGAGPQAPFLAQAVGLGSARLGDAEAMEPLVLHRSIVTAAVDWIRSCAAGRPLVLIVEDAQWIDPSTAEIVGQLVAETPERLLLLTTARQPYEASWPADRYETIELGPLDQADVAQLVEGMELKSRLTTEQIDQLIERSDGVPLYVEHLLGVLRRGDSLVTSDIPLGLDQLLTSMIEKPGVDHSETGLLATIGRILDAGFVADVLDVDDAAAVEKLETLCGQGILERIHGSGHPAYGFRHAQLQLAAYQHQLPSDRRTAHALVADTIERRGASADVDQADMARHYDLGGRPAAAVPCYLDSSAAAYRTGAMIESLRLVDRAIELSREIGPGPDRDGVEAELQLQRSICLIATEGFASRAGIEASKRSLALSSSIGDPVRFTRVTTDLFSGATVRGDRTEAAEAIASARSRVAGDDACALALDQLAALHLNILGRLPQSRAAYLSIVERLERRLGDRNDPRAGSMEGPTDRLAAAYTQLAPLNWLMGDADAGDAWLARAEDRVAALEGAKAMFTDAYVRSWVCWLRMRAGDAAGALAAAEEMSARSERAGLQMWAGFATVYRTVAAASLDPSDELEATLGLVVEMMQGMGIATMAAYFVSCHANAALALGRPGEAVERLTRAIALAEQYTELLELPEIHRQRAVARLAEEPSDVDGAVEDLLQASSIALDQGSTIYAVRALTDLVTSVDRARWPTAVLADLAEQLELVATPDRYPEVVRARRLVEVGGPS
jgi:class 3 adenylate cyclase